MTLIPQKSRDELTELEPVFQLVEASMGFLPNSMLTMAHWPELVLGSRKKKSRPRLNSSQAICFRMRSVRL
jgi:hypothetical protein